MPKEREDVEAKSSGSPEVYQQPKFMAWFEKAFPWLLVSGAALGLTLMIILPIIFFQEKTGDQLKAQSDLRLALLYTTGGTIAALGLLETYRKNTNDRAKANADIKAALKNQDHQTKVLKEQIRQFDENAFKERKAERRERYTKAVEQLGDEKPSIRMGGVYTLVGLVDEWLEEESIEKYEDRLKEGQVIINNLCAYIRSPFTLASHYDELKQDTPDAEGVYQDKVQEFYADKATLDSEADVRLGIIKEIHDRLRGPKEETPGTWSDFEYDFSGSIFFYPIDLTHSYYAKPINFSGSTYKSLVNFSGSTYKVLANFSDSTYEKDVTFSTYTYNRRSTYKGEAKFSSSTYKGEANFSNSIYSFNVFIYPASIDFSGSTYQKSSDFSGSTYQGLANFSGSTYKAETEFNDSFYESSVDFSNSTYYDRVEFHGYNLGSGYESLTYEGTANFSHSVYLGTPVFGPSTYESEAIFSNSIYSEPVNFSSSNTYEDKVDFSKSIYHGKVSIGASAYESQSNFRDSLYAEGADFTFAAFKGPHYFDGSVFYKALDLHGSVSYKEEPIFTHDYPTYTDPRPEYDKINRHITLFPAVGNDFTITLQGNQDPLDIPNLLKYCDFLDSLIPEKIEDYNQIINEIIITRDNFKSTQNIQEKDKYAEIFKEKNKELYKWREEVTTIVLQNGVEVSD